MIFERIAIIGVGLIGGSLGLAVKKRNLARVVVGIGRRPSSIRKALRRGAIDIGTEDLAKGAAGADLVVIATPVCLVPKIARAIAGSLKDGAVLTDAGSTKGEIVRAVEGCVSPKIFFAGSHPLAGSEKRGVLFADKDLFKGSIVIVTKTKKTKSRAVKTLDRFWRSLGAARVVIKSPEEHDKIVAEISHIPHIAATALVNSTDRKSLEFAAAGFKDTTRIAAGDPEVWRDICITNKKEILRSLDRYEGRVSRLKALIKNGRAEELYKEFAKSKSIREKLR